MAHLVGNVAVGDQQLGQPAPPPPVPGLVAAACRARLLALRPIDIAAACNALAAAVRGLPVTGGETAAAAAAAVETVVVSSVGPGTLKEVAELLRAAAALEYARRQMAAVGEGLGQAGQVAQEGVQRWARWARAESGTRQPEWGAAELRMVLAAARRAVQAQIVQAAERTLAEAQRICAAAHAAQEAIVGRLPAQEADPIAGAEDAAAEGV